MKHLWSESRMNRLPLLFSVIVRIAIAAFFIFYIINHVSHFAPALIITLAVVIVIFMIMSRTLKKRSIRLERMFVLNLRSRDIEAQVHGHRKPLYEGHLLDRDIHIADFEIPEGSLWAGKTLMELHLRNRFGVHVSSILRGEQRINIPSGTTIIYPGDDLQVIGSDEQLKALSDAIEEEMFSGDPEIEKREMKLRQILITGTSPFVGRTLMRSGIRDKYNCMVVGLERGEENLWQPDPDYVFQKGDIVWVVGEEDSLREIC
jgi:CPA2 family monovalent cation:H+ antiporter-2